MAMVLAPDTDDFDDGLLPPPPTGGIWTRDYRDAIPDERNRWEIIDGGLVMTPAPVPMHQDVSLEVAIRLREALRRTGAPGHVYIAAVDVWGSGTDVVQPDVLVTRAPAPAGAKHLAIQDVLLAIEITSPSSRRRDLRRKSDWYRRHGVPCYWVIDPDTGTGVVRTADGVRDACTTLDWTPPGGASPVTIDLPALLAAVRTAP
jgi:Uma2 family endonuclease